MTGPRIKATVVTDDRWYHEAICYPDHALYDSRDPDDIEEAKRICNTLCAVKDECLKDALNHESQPGESRHGVRGGLTEDERAKLPRPRVPKPIIHGTRQGYDLHLKRGIPSCDPCKTAERDYRNALHRQRKASA